jgi:hypothetical protein
MSSVETRRLHREARAEARAARKAARDKRLGVVERALDAADAREITAGRVAFGPLFFSTPEEDAAADAKAAEQRPNVRDGRKD